MTDTTRSTISGGAGTGRRLLTPALLVAAATCLGGCKMHSWFDQSVVGRWEVTPTTAPILDRITAIEGPDDEYVQYSEVTSDDLVPRPWEYRVGPGDFLQIIVFDLRPAGQPAEFQTAVDTRGMVYLEEVGEVRVAGLTADGIREAVSQAVRDLVTRPQVLVRVLERRQATYTMVGAVAGTGKFPIPKADWFLMDALAEAGWMREGTDEIFVIRQIPLSQSREVDLGSQEPGDRPGQDSSQPSGEGLLEDVDRLLDGGARPGAFGVNQQEGSQGQSQPQEPAVDLIDEPGRRAQPADDSQGLGDETTWMYLDGQWVRVNRGDAPSRQRQGSTGTGVLSGQSSTSRLVTQRIIRIPAQKLIQGDMRYNVVIEPGDIIRVPQRLDGLYFVAGFVNRPGGFALAQKLTLMRAIDQAGGVNQLGVPERIELVRMLEGDRQAIIQLDLRAINRGLEPDIYLKANDRINVGSAVWAYPLTVIRNGFRATYGFGFLLDRNFGNDVFGPPPRDDRFF
ncbi:MAG: polysaccharide biosynthesis/export family protein [Phycisphaerales bacterium JB060]